MNRPSRLAYWLVVLGRDTPKLIRLVLFLAGGYFLLTASWYAGFGCFLVLLWWKTNIVQARLEEIRDGIRGFSEADVLEAIKNGADTPPNPKGLLNEITALLRDVRNNQMNG